MQIFVLGGVAWAKYSSECSCRPKLPEWGLPRCTLRDGAAGGRACQVRALLQLTMFEEWDKGWAEGFG